MTHVLGMLRRRIHLMRFDLGEMSGALGDLGTFIPLAVMLVSSCGMDIGTVLIFAGLFNVITGVLFNQPIPVQPMKAIAAVAIAEGLAPGEIAAAGFSAGVLVLVLGLTGLVTWAQRVIPKAVVRGIQLGIGIKLAAKGVGMALSLDWWGLDSRAVAGACALLVLATAARKRFPSALVVFAAGLGILLLGNLKLLAGASLGWEGFSPVWPSVSEWKIGVLHGAIPQLPLTLLNSVIAVCLLSGDLFPGRAVSVRKMAISVGLMNVGACLFGGMPSCHGSGGLAGQYRFGGRTGGSVVMLGLAKLAIGLSLGAAAMTILMAFPVSVLGVLLVFAGLELALPAHDCNTRETFFVAAATAIGILAADTWIGFLFGLTAAGLLSRFGRSSDVS